MDKLCHRTIGTANMCYCKNGWLVTDNNTREVDYICTNWLNVQGCCKDVYLPIDEVLTEQHECKCNNEIPEWLREKIQDLVDGADTYINNLKERIDEMTRSNTRDDGIEIIGVRIKLECAKHRRSVYQKVLDSKQP
jgi:hypothetical protein